MSSWGIRRPIRIGIAPVILAGLLAFHCGRSPGSSLNVLVITVDTLRADRLGCYGYDRPTSPAIDRLAESGVRFEAVYSQAPLTLPSHCSIFTSRYTLSHGSVGHAYSLNSDVPTLAEMLKSRGMTTGAFVSNHVLDRKFGLAAGFDTYWQAYDVSVEARRALKKQGQDATTNAAVSWLREHREEDFFLWVHWFHPHKPYDPPPAYGRRFAVENTGIRKWTSKDLRAVWRGTASITPKQVTRLNNLYDGEVAFSDSQVGALLDELERLGLSENTLVVFTSDHGEVLFEHDRYFGHDIMMYEPAMRIPLIIRHPHWSPGVTTGLAQSIDIMPTILTALGVPSDAAFEGKDLGSVVRGEEPSTTQVAIALSYPPESKSLPIFGLRTDEWKLILSETKSGYERELYNVLVDPGERENLAAEYPDRAEALETYYFHWAETVETHSSASAPDLDQRTLENLRSLGYIQ